MKDFDARMCELRFAKDEFLRKVKRAGRGIAYWALCNPELAATLLTITIGAVASAAKDASRKRVVDREMYLKTRMIYDRSAGHYWELRKPLTPNQWHKFDELRAQGCRVGDALSIIGVLK